MKLDAAISARNLTVQVTSLNFHVSINEITAPSESKKQHSLNYGYLTFSKNVIAWGEKMNDLKFKTDKSRTFWNQVSLPTLKQATLPPEAGIAQSIWQWAVLEY